MCDECGAMYGYQCNCGNACPECGSRDGYQCNCDEDDDE